MFGHVEREDLALDVPEPYRSLLQDHTPRMSHIMHGIYVGDVYDAYDVLLRGAAEVQAVLNMIDMGDGELHYPAAPESVTYCNLPLIDFQYCDPRTWHEAADFIDRCKDGVLVHCLAGISRSPTAALAYLLKYEGLPLWRATRLLRKARPQARPAPQLLKSLKEFRKSLRWT